MGIVDDLLVTQQELAAERVFFEDIWRDCVDLAMPYASHKYDYATTQATTRGSLSGIAREPQAAQRSRELFDATAVWGAERLTAGMESLIIPRAQKWHGFSLDDPFAPEPSDVEEEWLDRLRDYCFTARYDSKSNFALSAQKSIKATTVLGTGVIFTEENFGRRGIDPVKVPFFYRYVPVIECYLGTDAYDDVDKCIRIYEWTARAAAEYFGIDKLSEKVQKAAESEKDRHKKFTFMHAVMPRDEAGEYKDKQAEKLFASFWCEVESRHLISHGGYFTFPYHVMWWSQTEGSPYGQSPIMSILSDIKMLQVMSKNAVAAAQQLIKPPMATMAGIYNQRLNLNPGAVNPGYLSENGVQKAQPIIQAQNPNLAETIMEMKRAGIRESLYINLFQILVDNPQMTATEAIIRANEKGELLGPAGAKIENAVGRMVDREVDIISRKGAFEDGSPLAPPESMLGKNIGVKFTGPLARLRRMQELEGVQAVMELAGGIAQYDPSALDKIDTDETLDIAREIRGAPRKMFRLDEEVAELRQSRAQQQEAMAAAALTEQMAGAAGKATPALKAVQEAQTAA